MSSVLLVVDPHFSAVDDAGYDPVCVCVVCVRVYAHYIISPRRGTPVRNKQLTKETPFWREESGHLVMGAFSAAPSVRALDATNHLKT